MVMVHRWSSNNATNKNLKKIGSHLTRPIALVNWKISSSEMLYFRLHISKIANKKSADNEGRLYLTQTLGSSLNVFSCRKRHQKFSTNLQMSTPIYKKVIK